MKKIIIFLMAFGLVLLSSAVWGQTELLVNGTFESWDDPNTPTGWDHIENISQESIEVHGGTYSAKHLGGTKDLGQYINVTGGNSYTISLWYKVTAGDGSDARIWSYWRSEGSNLTDNGAELRGPNNSYFDNNEGNWNEYTVTIDAPATADEFYFEVRTYSEATVYWDDFSVIENAPPAGPSLTLSQNSLVGFTYLFGNGPSTEQSFTVEGSDLSADIVITPPTNYEISETSGSNFSGDAITLTQSGGVVNNTTIYVRLEAGLTAGTYDEDITCSSTGATDKIINLSGSVEVPNTTTLPYNEDFSSGFGDTYTYTVAGTKPWAIVTGGAQANGFSGENPEEHWLVMPGIDFNAYSDEVITFTNFAKYGTIDANNYLKLFYSSDYPGIGNPTTYTWNELSFDQPAAGSVGSTEIETPSGIIDLSAISGNTVFLAFKYYSTDSPTSWRIDDILIYEDQSASEPANHPTDFQATANTSSEITLSWTDAVPAADSYLIKGSDVSYAAITDPIDGAPETDGALVQNVAAGVENHQFTGLNAETTYYFKIFPYNGLETTINYKVDGALQDDATTNEAPALPKIFFSEYIEGSSNNKAVEIYNGEESAIDLSLLTVNLYSNGSAEPSTNWTGIEGATLSPGESYVLYNSSATAIIQSLGNESSGISNFNGDDALEIVYNGTTTDVFGEIGNDPGTGWPVAGTNNATVDKTLIRKLSVNQGNISNLGSFGSSVENSEWIIQPTDYTGNLSYFATAWVGSTDSDWTNASNWDAGIPNASNNVILNIADNDPIITDSRATNNLLIKNDVSLTISSSAILDINSTLTNDAGTTGLVIKSDANGTGSLIHSTDNVPFTIERYITGGQNAGGGTSPYKYHLISIPLADDIQAGDVFTGSYLWHFIPNQSGENAWSGITSLTENLDNQKGFLSYVEDENDTFTFTGTMNNGSFSVAAENIDAGNVKLIPNPYPSAIDWETVDLTGTGLNPTIWLFNSSTGNYESYNAGAGAGQQYIPVGQAVFAEAATANPSLTFTNTNRTHNQGNGFYKAGNETSSDMLKIAVSANNSSDASFIRFREQADDTYNGYDDARKLKGFSGAPQLYTKSTDNHSLSINTLTNSQETVIVPLAFELEVSTEAVMSFEYLETFEPTVQIFLEDLLTNQMLDLRENSSYTFNHEVSNDPDRFKLHFMGVTSVNEQLATADHFRVWTNENQLYVLPTDNLTKGQLQIELFDLSGRLIQSVDKEVQKPLILSLQDYEGIMLVRIRNEKLVQTQKIFIR